jgi:hypothetical protein
MSLSRLSILCAVSSGLSPSSGSTLLPPKCVERNASAAPLPIPASALLEKNFFRKGLFLLIPFTIEELGRTLSRAKSDSIFDVKTCLQVKGCNKQNLE